MDRRPPESTRTEPLCPYTPLFRSVPWLCVTVRGRRIVLFIIEHLDRQPAQQRPCLDARVEGHAVAPGPGGARPEELPGEAAAGPQGGAEDRKSTRLNSSP